MDTHHGSPSPAKRSLSHCLCDTRGLECSDLQSPSSASDVLMLMTKEPATLG